jgi:hypothetical protein
VARPIQAPQLRQIVANGPEASNGIGQKFGIEQASIASGEGMQAYAKLALVSGVTGGVMAELQGGRFGNGFVTAGANALLAPTVEAASSNPGTQTVIAAVVGGTVSRIGGGKFANGAVTGAFQFALGRAMSSAGEKRSLEGLADGGGDTLPEDLSGVPSDRLRAMMKSSDPADRVGVARQAIARFGIKTHGIPFELLYEPSLSDRGLTTFEGGLFVRLGPGAYRSWSQLGATLGHEVQHLMQFTTLGPMGPKFGEYERREVEAYTYNIRSAQKFGNSQAEINRFHELHDYYKNRLQNN